MNITHRNFDQRKVFETFREDLKSCKEDRYIVLLKWVNYEETMITHEKTNNFNVKANNLKNIIKDHCKVEVYAINQHLLIILPKEFDNHKAIELLIDELYKKLQLCENVVYDCKFASIKFFTKKSSLNDFSLDKLLWLLNTAKTSEYYIDFNASKHLLIDNVKFNYGQINQLKRCIREDKLSFAFQPVIDSKLGNIIYYECLLRLLNDQNELVSVGPMIPLAEQYGLIHIIDEYVINMAIEELEKNPDITFSINISNLSVLNSTFLSKIYALLINKKVAKRLIIEITETSFNNDFSVTTNFINIMHSLGIRIALDDFGAGYTSLMQLKRLPVDIIKIDGSFIRDIPDNNTSFLILNTLIRMAKELNIETVAEFVENGKIAAVLLNTEIDCMQGNFFSPASIHRIWEPKSPKSN